MALKATPGRQRGRRPNRANDDAKQDRQHQGLDIGLADEMDLEFLQHDRDEGDGAAQREARQQAEHCRGGRPKVAAARRGLTIAPVVEWSNGCRHGVPFSELLVAE